MIIDFTISNFRSIKEPQTISFEATTDKHLEDYYVVKIGKYRLLKMISLLGANASGKSNILKAFALFPKLMLSPCKTKASRINYDMFALDNESRNGISEMKVNFICGETRYYYEVTFNNTVVSHELLRAYPLTQTASHKVYERSVDMDTMLSSITWGDKYKSKINTLNLSVNLLQNRTLFGSYQMSNVNISWMQDIIDWISSYFLPTVETSEQHLIDFTTRLIEEKEISKEQVVELLRHSDIGVTDLMLEKSTKEMPKSLINVILNDDKAPSELKEKIKNSPIVEETEIRMRHKGVAGEFALDLAKESNGTKRYYELSSILLKITTESHFVTIDELENRLHPDLYQHFISIYLQNSDRSQLIFTTHMREFLNDRDTYRDDSVYIAEKNECGQTSIYSLSDFDTSVLRKSTNRYNAYRAGRLGGIPHLGSTYIEKGERSGYGEEK